MKKLAYSLIVLSLLVLVTTGVSATDGNLIVNGDFEANADPYFPDVPTGTWTWYETTSLGGWTVQNTFPDQADYDPRLEIWDTLYGWPAASGTQYVELDGFDPTEISQTPATEGGYCYELSYAWSPRGDVADNQMKVYVGGMEVAHHVASGVGNTSTDWSWETYQFQAASTPTTIAFAEVGPDDQLGMLLDAVSLTECAPVTVGIDIKPGSSPNCFNVNGHGVVPVAILGSADFDVTQVEVSTLKFAGLDVRVKGNGSPQCSVEDVSGDFTYPEGAPDGYPDLVCQFVDDAALWNPDNGDATVTGYFLSADGLTRIEGSDSICIVP